MRSSLMIRLRSRLDIKSLNTMPCNLLRHGLAYQIDDALSIVASTNGRQREEVHAQGE